MFRKTSAMFSNDLQCKSSAVRLMTTKSGTMGIEVPNCRSACHTKSGKYTQQIVIFSACSRLIATAYRGVASGIRLEGYLLLINIATPPLVLMYGVTSQLKDSYTLIVKSSYRLKCVSCSHTRIGVTPVSYTHLDVYKRQGQECCSTTCSVLVTQ